MKVLLIGERSRGADLVCGLNPSEEHSVTHCADGEEAIAQLGQQGAQYDWVVVDGQAIARGDRDIAQAIRAVGPMGPASEEPDGGIKGSGGLCGCGVSWNKSGVLELNCRMHAMALVRTRAAAANSSAADAAGVYFEYHAPCSKTRQHDG